MNLKELNKSKKIIIEKIKNKEEEIEEKEKEINNFKIDSDDYENGYRDMLNEQGEIKIGYLTFDPAQIVKELDPIAYGCGLNDYVDGVDIEQEPEYQELQEELKDLEYELDDLESELEEIENEEE